MWGEWSPAAMKVAEQASVRRRAYNASLRCTLARNNAGRAFIIRPATRDSEHQLSVYDWIKANLPAFEYNTGRGWWVGPLEALKDAYKKMKPFDMVALSDGATQYLQEMGVIQ